jgi:hypothetical protein
LDWVPVAVTLRFPAEVPNLHMPTEVCTLHELKWNSRCALASAQEPWGGASEPMSGMIG